MSPASGSRTLGCRVLVICSVGLVAMCSSILGAHGWSEDGVGAVVRATARTSLFFFLAAYVASPLRAFVRNDATKRLLAIRRYVGLAYAVSHTLHLAAIIALARVSPNFEFDLVAIVVGGAAYVLLYAMAATSNDRAVTKLGVHRWRMLHRTGMHYNWFIFFQSYGPRLVGGEPLYVALGGAVVVAASLRFAAFVRARRAR